MSIFPASLSTSSLFLMPFCQSIVLSMGTILSSFSVINILRVRGSGGFIMNRTSVQQKDGIPPWREIRLFALPRFGYFFRIIRLLVLLPFSR
jgi:hypothetical protein